MQFRVYQVLLLLPASIVGQDNSLLKLSAHLPSSPNNLLMLNESGPRHFSSGCVCTYFCGPIRGHLGSKWDASAMTFLGSRRSWPPNVSVESRLFRRGVITVWRSEEEGPRCRICCWSRNLQSGVASGEMRCQIHVDESNLEDC